ncbi:MAG: RNA polymerase sigma factor [Desulfobacterales bacterium]
MPETHHPTPASPTPDTATENTELAAAAKNGNRYAFTRLADRYHERIFKMVFYRTRSRPDAEDITQDIFLQAFRSIHRLKEPERFEGWLYRIAMNRVTDHHRKKKFRSLFSPLMENDREDIENAERPHEAAEAVDRVVQAQFWEQIQALLGQLPRMEKEVFMLRFFDDLGIKEISQVLGKSESTIKTHLYRALAKFKEASSLREFLGENLP